MIKQLYKYLWLTPVFVFIQIYILNQVLFNGYINPYFYIMLVICLPQITPKWFLLLFAFFLGLLLDIFSGSIGFHSTSCVLIAFLKPSLEKIVIPKNTISGEQDFFLQKLGFKVFSVFAFVFVFYANLRAKYQCLFSFFLLLKIPKMIQMMCTIIYI